MRIEEMLTKKRSRLLLDVSLWSGNLVNLQESIDATCAWADWYHLDVADAHYVPSLLFFPDIIRAIRRYTEVPLHTHLMMTDPLDHLESFVEAGSDLISLHVDQGEENLLQAAAYLKGQGVRMGLVLCVEDEITSILPYLREISLILVMGTKIGIKGASLEESTPERIGGIKKLLVDNGVSQQIILSADGGIREHTVPLLRQAGVDMITPGSLVFASTDLDSTVAELHSL
ncbi:MAG: ribulose-phosphate 3-epimerase [Sphaerochaeta sp.]|nr:ribulose-phosphate 3-epimerase [Sphaerochaeta sp.]